MDIAIVSPSPVPYTIGGMEKLMYGLYTKINELTVHRAELIKLPTPENSFWNLIESYERFYHLDLKHFDIIISSKYPAWMVQHPNHIIYMAHHLRGLFDTYHFLGLPNYSINNLNPEIINILKYMNNQENMEKDLDRFFDMLLNLKVKQDDYPEDLFNFPGPFIRSIIHFLDAWALHPSRIKKYYSISNNVKNRENYFPKDVHVQTIYPPTLNEHLSEGSYTYFLTVGRLDGPKRILYILFAMQLIKNRNIRLLIAGTGPEEYSMKQLFKNDPRIEFLGYVNDQKLGELYKDALAIVYVPMDEDYGLVTIEAMNCKKPVITCSDSGGTIEFVIHEQTGLIASSNPVDIFQQMQKLVDSPILAKQLGENAKELVKDITWEKCIAKLINI